MAYSLSAASINLILHTAQWKGADRDELCRRVGLDPTTLTNPDARIPTRQAQLLWRAAIELTGDPDLPLRLGESVHPTSLGLLVYLMMHCPTLGDALEKLVAYQDIACAGVQTAVESRGNRGYLSLRILDADIIYPSYVLGSELSIYVRTIPALIGRAFPVQEVHFTYAPPAERSEYQRVFGTQAIFFTSSFDGVVFDQALLAAPILNANPALFSVFEKHASDYLQKIQHPDSLSYRVRQEIVQGLKGQEPALRPIARKLALSERNLQLKLKEEGVTFRQLLDDVRKEIAVTHLREPYLSTTDIAYLIGFSELSVFTRTFKKWTGRTPGAFRAKQVAGRAA